ncbi:MAG: DUF1501 domain-containing protein [Planctomycetota bacterium]|nr:DUF1501 domain-containing protein [Planctomycetota bacterium]MDA1178413.1 DUF1501 domain-containing protein [Planctomycetota bacterium]
MSIEHSGRNAWTRRDALRGFANGFGLLGLASVCAAADAGNARSVLPVRAKRVIFLFMSGGPSHLDLFDPKPTLARLNGEPLPFEKPKLERTKTGNLVASRYKFSKHGQCGTEVSELFPQVAKRVDDICLIRSMVADNINHNGACLQMNTGEQAFSRPSLGSWLLYGLGSENQNLPGFVVISPAQPAQGAPLWSSSFLPAEHQGTLVSDLQKPIANLGNARFAPNLQRQQLEWLRELNTTHAVSRSDDSRLNARIESFELAFRMQREAPEAFDLERETEATRQLYGVGQPMTDHFGRQCLMARRLVERGVRMVQVYHTQTSQRSSCQLWDQHSNLRKELPINCLSTDQPIAGLLADLKSRGLLDETLVVWGGEFGRTPTAEGDNGREHHPFGFSMWLAGGGVQGGIVHGATDEFGWHSVEDKVHIHDLHATILHLMGIDHEQLTYRYAGRDYRLTDVHGRVVRAILG